MHAFETNRRDLRSNDRSVRCPRQGFTLIELLTVIAIISILAGVAVSGFSSVGARNFSTQSLQISDTLERAREYAVANNTYTWVTFYASTATPSQPVVYVATVVSVNGTSQILSNGSLGSSAQWSSGQVDTTATGSKCALLDKVASFPQMGLSNLGSYNSLISKLPAVASSNLAPLASSTGSPAGPSFLINVPGLGSQTFTQSIEFTPSGEAKVQAAPTQAIEFDLCQYHGASASSTMVAAVRVNGFTGQAEVYQP
jgi:prepilin-type N-terminal cleavage/methylation domain-containing protein